MQLIHLLRITQLILAFLTPPDARLGMAPGKPTVSLEHFKPQYKYTDILGTLLVAHQIFDASPKTSRKILVIFSDMRHHTRELDLESGRAAQSFRQLEKRSKQVPLATLTGVEVYAMGVDGAGKPITYWQSLNAFWIEYFEKAGAILRGYSVLRDIPSITSGARETKAP